MLITACDGYELEKEKSNSPEDFFNRSVIQYIKDGSEKTLNVLYLRYFDEIAVSWTPYSGNPLFKTQKRDIYMADIMAMVCLIRDPNLSSQRRIYINSGDRLAAYFKDTNLSKLEEVFISIDQAKPYDMTGQWDFILKS